MPLLLHDPRVTSIKAVTHRAALPQEWMGEKLTARTVDEFFSGEDMASHKGHYDVALCLCGRTYSQTSDEAVIQDANASMPIKVVDFCRKAEVRHMILASSVNVRLLDCHKRGYPLYKKMAEDHLIASGVPFTIFRPTLIFGDGEGGVAKLVKHMQKYRIMPVLGDGQKLEQPIHVQEAAEFFYKAAMTPPENGIFEIGGLAAMTYNMMLQKIASFLKRKITLLHLPIRPFTLTLDFLERRGCGLSVNSEQLVHIDTDLDTDNQPALQHYPVKLRPFDEWLSTLRLK